MDLTTWRNRDKQATRRGLKRYGMLTALVVIGIVLISAGMPAHFLWKWLGVPLVLAFACTFTPLLFHIGRFLFECLDR